MPTSLTVSVRRATVAVAGVLGVSLGVVGWLAASAATFGVAEHAHLTVDGMSSHTHGYAAPLAAGAGVSALLALLLLLLLHLGSDHTSWEGQCRRRSGNARETRAGRSVPAVVGRLAPVVAAVLFVAVEAVELSGSGTPACTWWVLLAGAAMQGLTASAAAAAARALVRGIEGLAARPGVRPWIGAARRRPLVSTLLGVVVGTSARAWDGRAPPACTRVLVPVH